MRIRGEADRADRGVIDVKKIKERNLEWSILFQARRRMHERYPTIWHVPLVKRQSDVLRRMLKDGMSVLDVGAGSRGAEDRIRQAGIKVRYRSLDVDRKMEHDFYDLADVHETFDVVLLSQVIEHVTLQEGLGLLAGSRDKLRDGGLALVSTPNIFHPNRFFTTSDHKSHYAYDELSGILNAVGFEVEHAYRVFNDAFLRYVLKAYIFGFVFRFLSIDYAHSIVIVARKVRTQVDQDEAAPAS
jgi:2-polyprenyl-3-methyl-5-hydroxy-6-metoxy-1,4-benzoquinol methylase